MGQEKKEKVSSLVDFKMSQVNLIRIILTCGTLRRK